MGWLDSLRGATVRQRNQQLSDRYRQVLTRATGLQLIPVTVSIAEEAARIRSIYNLKTPDSVQLATAILAGAQIILTNDSRWPVLPSLRYLVVDHLAGASP